MKTDCLNERDLILLHYGETPERTTTAAATAHLAGCQGCRGRAARLAADLARIPAAGEAAPAAATRVAARVSERLNRRGRWLPVTGAVAAGALAVAVMIWTPGLQSPGPDSQPVARLEPAATNHHPPAPELDLLEQLDFLEELDTLRAIEGV